MGKVALILTSETNLYKKALKFVKKLFKEVEVFVVLEDLKLAQSSSLSVGLPFPEDMVKRGKEKVVEKLEGLYGELSINYPYKVEVSYIREVLEGLRGFDLAVVASANLSSFLGLLDKIDLDVFLIKTQREVLR